MKLIKETSKKIVKALFHPENKKSLLPNWLSFTRTIGGVTIPLLSHNNASLSILAGATGFVAISDFLDGKVARLLNAESEDGALLDVISDKFFSILLIIGIIPNNHAFLINGALESAISVINANYLSKGGHPKSNILGKVKIWPLSFALAAGYISVALKNSTFISLNAEQFMKISTMLSAVTVPLELVNIKEYIDESKQGIKIKLDKNKRNKMLIYNNQKVIPQKQKKINRK